MDRQTGRWMDRRGPVDGTCAVLGQCWPQKLPVARQTTRHNRATLHTIFDCPHRQKSVAVWTGGRPRGLTAPHCTRYSTRHSAPHSTPHPSTCLTPHAHTLGGPHSTAHTRRHTFCAPHLTPHSAQHPTPGTCSGMVVIDCSSADGSALPSSAAATAAPPPPPPRMPPFSPL
eukprot:333675-Chlamydomonas_euryale.AAC.1